MDPTARDGGTEKARLAIDMTRSIAGLRAAIGAGKMHPRESVEQSLMRIARLDPQLRAFTDVAGVASLSDAMSGADLPLQGVTVAVKDVFDVRGMATRAGSQATPSDAAQADSSVVARLRAAGCAVVGKTVTHELAYGVVSEPTVNPWNPDCIPGGSSGGSAAAIAAGLAHVGIGSDTGGSVRVPASLCGVVGYKPTFGLFPQDGMLPLAPSLDHVGLLARSCADIAVAAKFMLNPDDQGGASLQEEFSRFTVWASRGDLKGVRLGISDRYFNDGLHSDVYNEWERVVAGAEEMGAAIVEVRLADIEAAPAILYTTLAPEASAANRRLLTDRPRLLGRQVRERLEQGHLIPAADYVDAQRARQTLIRSFKSALETVDAIVAPTTPLTATPRGVEMLDFNGATSPIGSVFGRPCFPASLTGFPALSLPTGRGTDGMPIGTQLIGAPFQDASLLALGQVVHLALRDHVAAKPVLSAL